MTVQYFPRPGTGTQVSMFDPQQLAQLRRQAGQDGQNQATDWEEGDESGDQTTGDVPLEHGR